MRVVFRVDSSIMIGTGHVMRCLTIAHYLHSIGYNCVFISRSHIGPLGNLIQKEGHKLYLLDNDKQETHSVKKIRSNPYLAWLGVDWILDAAETIKIIDDLKPQWLIVDHYALDINWETKIRPFVSKIMVIDDLADRKHDCDIILDQTFGRKNIEYIENVPGQCKILCGSNYSLLREEFAMWREASFRFREVAKLDNILINLGGIDKDDFTSRVLEVLKSCEIPKNCKLTIVMGSNAPWVSQVKSVSDSMPWKTNVMVGVNSMAEIMSNADLAIGAAGSTTWERCCLGVPSIQLVIAKNQYFIAEKLQKAKATKLLKKLDRLPYLIQTAPNWMPQISKKCRSITDGEGVKRVVKNLRVKFN